MKTVVFFILSLSFFACLKQESQKYTVDISIDVRVDSLYTFDYIVKIENNDTIVLYCNYHPIDKEVIEFDDTIIINYLIKKKGISYSIDDTLLIDLNNFHIASVGFNGNPVPPGFTFVKIYPGKTKYLVFREKIAMNRFQYFHVICRYIVFSTERSINSLNRYVLGWENYKNSGECKLFLRHFIINGDGKVVPGEQEVAEKYIHKKFPIYW
jgi:hypothetical protein